MAECKCTGLVLSLTARLAGQGDLHTFSPVFRDCRDSCWEVLSVLRTQLA